MAGIPPSTNHLTKAIVQLLSCQQQQPAIATKKYIKKCCAKGNPLGKGKLDG